MMIRLYILAFLSGSVLLFWACRTGDNTFLPNEEALAATPDTRFFEERKQVYSDQLQQANDFLIRNKSYNQEVVFLIDMRIPSGNYRFFVHDLKHDSIQHRALVAHGSGSVVSDDSLVFSNTPNSYQTSLGKYKIGASYTGSFGKSYKLHGLDATNNKAFERYVVLHPYGCVPDEEQDYPICESLGCPMVSHQFMETLYTIIDRSSRPILMIIYY